jgi:hypothetical protein
VLDDDRLLLGLRFSLNVSRPLKPAPAQHYRWHASARQQHPALLLRVSNPVVDLRTVVRMGQGCQAATALSYCINYSVTSIFRVRYVILPNRLRPACVAFLATKHSQALLLTGSQHSVTWLCM